MTETRRTELLVGVGVALLSAAIVLSTFYSRADGDLDWSNFGVGIVATLALLAVAAAGVVRVADPALKVALVSWPAAFGALGAGLMVATAMDVNDASPWIVGLVVVAIGAAGYYVVRRPAPALAVVVGLVVLYAKLLDLMLDLGDGDNALVIGGAVVVVFTLAVTGAAWFLPGRDVIAITVGAFAAWTYVSLIAAVSVFFAFAQAFSAGFDEGGSSGDDTFSAFHDDIYYLLVFSLILIAVWGFLSFVSGHAGYRVLIVGLASAQIPASILVLGVDHPSWVGLVVVIVGALVLGAAAMRVLRSGTPTSQPPHAPQPPQAPPAQTTELPPPPPPYQA